MAEYHRLSRTGKVAHALRSLRQDPVECPDCQNGVDPAQLDAHGPRCPGRQWGSSGDLLGWLPWAIMRGLGIKWGTMWKWLKRGAVRRRKDGSGRWRYARTDVLAALDTLSVARTARRSRMKRRAAQARWRRAA